MNSFGLQSAGGRTEISEKGLSGVRGSVGKDHIVCCDPGTALCGADQRGEMFGLGRPDNRRMCTACAVLSGNPLHKCCFTCPGDSR